MWKAVDIAAQAELEDAADAELGTYSVRSSTTGHKPVNKGEILVTSDAYKNLIPTGHAAIVYDKNHVIESLSKGVVEGLNNWERNKSTIYGLLVTAASTNGKAQAAADYCAARVGRFPYNYNFADIWTRSKFYCSQLVWAAFYDVAGIDLNTDMFGDAIHPMELYWSDETITFYTYNKSGGSYK